MDKGVLIFTGIVMIFLTMLYLHRYKWEYLSHFTITTGVCFLVSVFAPMVWIVEGRTHYRGLEVMEYTVQATLYFLIGYIVYFVIVYQGNSKKRLRNTFSKKEKIECDVDIRIAWIAYIFFFILYNLYLTMRGRSLISQLTLGQMGDYSKDIMSSISTSYWFLMVSLNAMVTLSIVIVYVQEKYKFIAYMVYIATFLLTISAGYRHLMLDMLIAPIIMNSLTTKRRISGKTVIFLLVVAYLIVSWIGAMRGVYRLGQGELEAYESESAFDAFMINIEVFFPYFAYTNYIPKYGRFSLGGTYIAGIFQLIPSILWPGKERALSLIRNDSGYILMLAAFEGEGIADPYWSEGYRNFGILGIIICMAILAICSRKIRELQFSNKISDLLLYAISVPFMFQVLTRNFQNALQDGLFLILPILIIRKFIFSLERSRRHYEENSNMKRREKL